MSEQRLVDLESRLAHQDHMLNQLNDVVTEQQAKIMRLEELCSALIERLRSIDDASADAQPADERPPHY